MLRSLYKQIVRLHPAAFRHHFGEEMLSIFDSAKTRRAASGLVLDGLLSLGRQWLGRPRFSGETQELLGEEAELNVGPSFAILDPFHPQKSAVINGLVLSLALFCLTCFAIRYSWIRILHIHIPEVEVESSWRTTPDSRPHGEGTSAAPKNRQTKTAAAPEEKVYQQLQVEPMPVEAGSVASSFEASSQDPAISATPRIQPLKQSRDIDLQLESYVGTYLCASPKFTVSISAAADVLTVRIDDQRQRTLSPLSPTTFVIDGTDNRIEFDQDGRGAIYQLRLLQGNRQYIAKRQ